MTITKEQASLAADALQEIMTQAQVFASAWAIVGGRFDSGGALEDAGEAKAELRTMVASLAMTAAHGAAQAKVPLTEQEMHRVVVMVPHYCDDTNHSYHKRIGRAIEAAHHITGANNG